jgi:2-polyprenyl-3-methyl-5-hydroxy-6-metoxy-1,4-benzoquinol methylase
MARTTDAPPLPAVEPDALRAYSALVWGYRGGFDVANMIHLGIQLGLYRTLRGTGPVDADELAERTGLSARWLLEWLRGQAAARVLVYLPGDEPGTGRFALPPEGEHVLADDDNLASALGAFVALPDHATVVERLPEAFRTGLGLSYDDRGPNCAHQVERTLAAWHRHKLVQVVLPAVDGLVARLERGALVADVGCGSGLAVLAMARAFPASELHGYDLSRHAIDRARANQEAAGVGNAEFHVARGEDLPADGRFDLVTSFDCIHDMTRPDLVIAAIRRALRPDGIWLCADIKSAPTFEENLERNPMLAMMYANSVMSCMSSALSEPGGLGLGTLGFNPAVAERMAREAGFSSFAAHDFDSPANLYYEIRP